MTLVTKIQGGLSYHIVGPCLLGTTRPMSGATNVGRLFSVEDVTAEQEQTNKQTKTKQNKTKQNKKRHLDPLCDSCVVHN